jgi:hypothetical protein
VRAECCNEPTGITVTSNYRWDVEKDSPGPAQSIGPFDPTVDILQLIIDNGLLPNEVNSKASLWWLHSYGIRKWVRKHRFFYRKLYWLWA